MKKHEWEVKFCGVVYYWLPLVWFRDFHLSEGYHSFLLFVKRSLYIFFSFDSRDNGSFLATHLLSYLIFQKRAGRWKKKSEREKQRTDRNNIDSRGKKNKQKTVKTTNKTWRKFENGKKWQALSTRWWIRPWTFSFYRVVQHSLEGPYNKKLPG